ncbi:TAP-like protein [Actinokineospora auranticolor]|uniref:TAP-like protein n=1 Tax=Actinokineospora auranticolor TaxID=155976 RepID=A0A2S6GKD0_9PSEU|nr:TAP-like protein [Actinokineospora auranticolor]
MLGLAACVTTTPAHAATTPTWTTCVDAPLQECATLQVPLDYRDPGGPRISLAVSRIRTARPDLRRGVLLLIPTGPGNPGLTRPTTLGLRLPRPVLDRYDIVGFDPRGTGRSTPASCGVTGPDAEAALFSPWPGPDGDISGNVAKAKRIADACARNGGDLLRHISSRTEAMDIDRIRQALGERTLSSWGVSYGTYPAAVHATLFPDRTDRVVLDSSGDPDPSRVARGWAANFAVGARDRFPDFAAWAAARDAEYHLGATPDAVTRHYLAVAETLDHNPRPDLSGALLRSIVFTSLQSDASFPLAATVLRGDPTPPLPVPSPEAFQRIVAVGAATACNDVRWPRSVEAHAAAVARDRTEYPLTGGMPANIWACSFWPYPAGDPVVISSRGPENVLLAQNRRDPNTPYSGALRMRAAFGHRARMVSVDSGGHGAYLANGNACGDAAVTAFLVDGTHRDATC